MALVGDGDKAVGWSFGLEFDGVAIKQIQEISGLSIEIDVIDHKHNTDAGKYVQTKLPGRTKAGEVTLTRGFSADTSFEKWMKQAQLGDVATARKGGSIIFYDYMGEELKRYKLTNCYPKKLELGALKAGDTSVLTEKLTLVHEGVEPA
jgi:phage tail-like protein